MNTPELNFDEVVAGFDKLSPNGRVTLLYRLIKLLGPAQLRTVIRYCYTTLDTINRALPDDHPSKQRYGNRVSGGTASGPDARAGRDVFIFPLPIPGTGS